MYGYFIDRLKALSLDIYAIEVFFRGETVFHYDASGNIRYPVYSVTKSITSSAFSLACSDRLMTADACISEFFPNRYKVKMSENFCKLPVKRFLTMTVGKYPFRPCGENWLDTILSIDTDFSDTSFHYSNIPAYLAGVAIENAVGKKLIDYLDRRLFEPLGIPEPPFALSPENHFYGATGMSFSVSELAAIGRLYLQNGIWNKESIIDSKLLSQAVTPYVKTGVGDGYGYFFRIANDHFSMVGKWGQRCMVYPSDGLVIAYLSNQPERCDELYGYVKTFGSSILKSGNTSR